MKCFLFLLTLLFSFEEPTKEDAYKAVIEYAKNASWDEPQFPDYNVIKNSLIDRTREGGAKAYVIVSYYSCRNILGLLTDRLSLVYYTCTVKFDNASCKWRVTSFKVVR